MADKKPLVVVAGRMVPLPAGDNLDILGADSYLKFDEHSSAPGTPASGTVALYAKADGMLYSKDDAGVETVVTGGGGSSEPANQIVYGTGAGIDSDADLTYTNTSGQFWVNTINGFSGSVTSATPGTVVLFGGGFSGTGTGAGVGIVGGAGGNTGGAGGAVSIQGGGVGGGGAGGAVSLVGGTGNTGAGGAATVAGGNRVQGTDSGGAAFLLGGQGGGSTGVGGAVTITSGAGAFGGTVTISSGMTNTSSGATTAIVGGRGGTSGGSATVTGGIGDIGNGGDVILTGGSISTAGFTGGSVALVGAAGVGATSAGGHVTITAGAGVTTGAGGNVDITAGASPSGISGSIRWASPLVSTSNLRFSHGTSALATNATEGFFHIQSCAGAPTGVPANIPTGQIPAVVDSTNSRLYLYIGGTWKSVGVA